MQWEGSDDATVSVIFSSGDEGQITDRIPAAFAGLAEGDVRVLVLPCIGGPLETRDDRSRQRIVQAGAGVSNLVLAGFSRGARVSAGLVDRLHACALVVFAYPFHARTDPHPHGRDRELAAVSVPVLLVQGTRDSHGNQQQVRGYRLPEHIEIHWMEDANHGLVPRTGFSAEAQLAAAMARVRQFIQV